MGNLKEINSVSYIAKQKAKANATQTCHEPKTPTCIANMRVTQKNTKHTKLHK